MVAELVPRIRAFAKQHGLGHVLDGQTGYRFPDGNLRSPDVSFVAAGQEYLGVGVRLLWVVDPDKGTAVVYRPGQTPRRIRLDGALDGEDVLPDLSCLLRELLGYRVPTVSSSPFTSPRACWLSRP